MATPAAVLSILVKASTADATAALAKTQAQLEATAVESKALSTAGAKTGTALRKMGTAAKWGGAALAVGFVFEAKKAIEVTQDLAKTTISLNQNLGIGVKKSSQWGAVLKARGVDSQKAGMAFKTFATQVDAANKGSATSIKTFKELGISQKELASGQGNVQKLLLQTADGIDKLGAGTQRTAAESKLFGRGWQTVVPLMRDGSAALKENLDLTVKYGDYLDKKGLKVQQDLLASNRETTLAWQGMQVQLAQKLAPAIIKVEGQFQHMAAILANPKLTDSERFKKIGHIIRRDFSKALDFVLKLIPQIASKVGQTAPKIAIALVQGFLHADVWGQLAIGAWFITKLGGFGAFRKVGTTMGKRMGLGIEAGLLLAIPLLVPFLFKMGEKLGKALRDPIKKVFGGVVNWIEGAFTDIVNFSIDRINDLIDAINAIPLVPNIGHIEHINEPLKLSEHLKKLAKQYGLTKQAADASSVGQVKAMLRAAGAFDKAGHKTVDALKRSALSFTATTKVAKDSGDKQQKSANDTAKNAAKASDKTQKSNKATGKSTANLADSVGTSTGKIKTHTTKDLGDANKAGSAALGQMAKHGAGSVHALAHATFVGYGNIQDNMNKALKKLKAGKPVEFGMSDAPAAPAGGTRAYAMGGILKAIKGALVPGYGSGDKVPLHVGGELAAMVEPGELVSVANRTATAGLMGVNSMIPRHAHGGVVGFAKGGTAAGSPYRFPFQAGNYSWGRTDMGVDFTGSGAIGAIGAGSIIRTSSPGWPNGGAGPAGQGWVLRLAAGPPKGLSPTTGDVFTYEGVRGPVRTGKVAAGETVGSFYPGSSIETGWWGGPGGENAAASPTYSEGDVTTYGSSMRKFLTALEGGKGPMGGGGSAPSWKDIARAVLKGPGGPMQAMGQKALDKVWRAANAYGRRKAPGAATPGGSANVDMKGAHKIIASWYGPLSTQGPHPVGAGGVPIRGNMFAELGMGHAMGSLPMGARVAVGYRGKTLVGTKEDIGLGGGGGQAIDLWTEFADNLGFDKSKGIDSVMVKNLARGGKVGFFGDSLGVGMKPYLPSDWYVNTVGGRGSAATYSQLQSHLGGKNAIFWEMGANDSAGTYKNYLGKVDKNIGERGLALMTLAGVPQAGEENAAMRGDKRKNALADWAAIAHKYNLRGPHTDATGYRAMADRVKSAGNRALSAAGKGSSAGEVGPDAWKKDLKKLEKLEAHVPIKPDSELDKLVRHQKFLGLQDHLWHIGHPERDKHSSKWEDKLKQFVRRKGRHMTALLNFRKSKWAELQAKKARARLTNRTDDDERVQKQIQAFMGTTPEAKPTFDVPGGWDQALTQIASDKAGEKNLVGFIEAFTTKYGLSTSEAGTELGPNEIAYLLQLNEGLLSTYKDEWKITDRVANKMTAKLPKSHGPEKKFLKRHVPALRKREGELIGIGGSGLILDTQVAIDALKGQTTVTGPDLEAQLALQKQLTLQAQQAYLVSQAQTKILAGFPAYGGAFAEGGVVPGPAGAPRTIIAHGGESVGGAANVRVVIQDQRTRVFVNDKEVRAIVKDETRQRRGPRVGRGM